MMSSWRENLPEKLRRLPPPAKDWLASPDVAHALGNIERAHNLSGGQTALLSEVVAGFVTGAISDQTLLDFIRDELRITDVVARKVLWHVVTEVLGPIQESLAKTDIDIEKIRMK